MRSWGKTAKDTSCTLCHKEEGKIRFEFFLIGYFMSFKSNRGFVCTSFSEEMRYSPLNSSHTSLWGTGQQHLKAKSGALLSLLGSAGALVAWKAPFSPGC